MNIPSELQLAIEDVRNRTDCWPWYWIAYGEKCYAFACVEAYPAEESDPYPRPGSQLGFDGESDGRLLIGENGTKMIVEREIASIEHQCGDAVCKFIAESHAALVKPSTAIEPGSCERCGCDLEADQDEYCDQCRWMMEQ